MRKKEWKIVVTFHTTAEAMAMEKACNAAGAPGRMIPVPRIISAGCGLAWAARTEAKEELEALMAKVGIEREAIHECLL